MRGRLPSPRSVRPHPADPFGRGSQNRIRIAQLAARLIAEHGIADWALAKRKAARQLMLPVREPLPGDDEIEAALAAHHALFGGDAHRTGLRTQREEALAWMRRLARFRPTLVGGVAAGWATEHSDIRIELVADDAKGVELALINEGVDYRAVPVRGADAPPQLHIETPRGGVRLVVVDAATQRQRPRKRPDGSPEPRLSTAALETLLRAP